MNTGNLTSKAKKALGRVLDSFRNGDLSPLAKLTSFEIPSDSPALRWSMNNQLLAVFQAKTLDIRGYRQWEKVGRKVCEPGAVYIWVRNEYIPKGEKERAERESRDPKSRVYWGLKPVFPYYNTEAIPGKEHLYPDEYTKVTRPPLIEVAEAWGLDVSYSSLAGARGFCDPTSDRIVLGTEDWRTFFHELGHMAHARVAGVDDMLGTSHEEKEAIAELTAAAIAEMYGASISGTSWKYIESHSDEDPLDLVLSVAKTVAQGIDMIFKTVEERGVSVELSPLVKA